MTGVGNLGVKFAIEHVKFRYCKVVHGK